MHHQQISDDETSNVLKRLGKMFAQVLALRFMLILLVPALMLTSHFIFTLLFQQQKTVAGMVKLN